jgi:hypothetical protein
MLSWISARHEGAELNPRLPCHGAIVELEKMVRRCLAGHRRRATRTVLTLAGSTLRYSD